MSQNTLIIDVFLVFTILFKKLNKPNANEINYNASDTDKCFIKQYALNS